MTLTCDLEQRENDQTERRKRYVCLPGLTPSCNLPLTIRDLVVHHMRCGVAIWEKLYGEK